MENSLQSLKYKICNTCRTLSLVKMGFYSKEDWL